jgi:hypothetical protein
MAPKRPVCHFPFSTSLYSPISISLAPMRTAYVARLARIPTSDRISRDHGRRRRESGQAWCVYRLFAFFRTSLHVSTSTMSRSRRSRLAQCVHSTPLLLALLLTEPSQSRTLVRIHARNLILLLSNLRTQNTRRSMPATKPVNLYFPRNIFI